MLYITGITGHTGRYLFERLEKENWKEPIRLVMHSRREDTPWKYAMFNNTKLHLEFIVGDLENEDFVKKSMYGVDTILHISGIRYSTALVQAAIDNGVDWCILVHTTSRFSKFRTSSAEYTEIEENILQLRGQINITIARPTMIYGSSRDKNMYRLITYLYSHRLFPVFGRGKNLMQPVFVKDLADAYFNILTHKKSTLNKEYDLSGSSPLPYIEILKIISKKLGRKNIFIYLPINFSILATRVYNFIAKRKAIISVEQVMRMNEDKAFSHQVALSDFGYNPISIKDGI